MAIVIHYNLTTIPAQTDDLLTALRNLMQSLNPIAGFEGAEILRQSEDTCRFAFVERWRSAADLENGAARIPKDAMQRLSKALVGRPDRVCYETIG